MRIHQTNYFKDYSNGVKTNLNDSGISYTEKNEKLVNNPIFMNNNNLNKINMNNTTLNNIMNNLNQDISIGAEIFNLNHNSILNTNNSVQSNINFTNLITKANSNLNSGNSAVTSLKNPIINIPNNTSSNIDPNNINTNHELLEKCNSNLMQNNLNYNQGQIGINSGFTYVKKISDLKKLTQNIFLWNHFHIKEFFNLMENKIWCVWFTYGFFEQVECLIYGQRFLVTVIGRRNRKYAGTRYLKRGINDEGEVANDVETEQILEEISTSCPEKPIISSYVHIRGSVPIYWYQEQNGILPKPDIKVNYTDVFFESTKKHFMKLIERYGEPIIACNLTSTSNLLIGTERTPVLFLNGNIANVQIYNQNAMFMLSELD